jgi:hypothetical protein
MSTVAQGPRQKKNILTSNIAIKRYCDILIIFYHRFLSAKVSFWRKLLQGMFCYIKTLPWLGIDTIGPKLSNYRNTLLSQYCVQKCRV